MEINVPFSIYPGVFVLKKCRQLGSHFVWMYGILNLKKIKFYSRYVYQKCYNKCMQKKDKKDKLASFSYIKGVWINLNSFNCLVFKIFAGKKIVIN